MSDCRPDDGAWAHWREQWDFQPGVTYLQHGAQGPPPRPVVAAWREWTRSIGSNPMAFCTRTADEHMLAARRRMAGFVGCPVDDLVFMINTTMGIHAVAASLPLRAGDEVLLSSHEYGIVRRTWQRACDRSGARLVTVQLPWPVRSPADVVEGYLSGVSPRTRVLSVTHITSPTGTVFPVEELCRRGRQLGLWVCVDGAHALAMLPLDIARLDCDFYASSCHKWLSAPPGSGFLYAHPRVQPILQPLVVSFGASWRDVWWCGTRDFSPFLGVPAAIDFLEAAGLEAFRRRTHDLARYARIRITELTGMEPMAGDSPEWYGSMVSLPMPAGDMRPVHEALWKKYGIEVALGPWENRNLIRVSCHLYTSAADIDRLVDALKDLGIGRFG